jgi:hypothetical protein
MHTLVKTFQKEINVLEQKIRKVEKAANGNIVIPYDRNGEKRDFIIDPRAQKIIVSKYVYFEQLKKKDRKTITSYPINLSSQI